MDTRIMMLLVCMIVGMAMSLVSVTIMPAGVVVGAIVAAIPGWMLYSTMKRSGVDALIRRPVRGEVLVLYISGTRRIFPLVGRELMERYIKLPGYGRVRVTRGSDYIFAGWKTVFAMAGVAHTIPMEKARQAMEFRKAGLQNIGDVAALATVTGKNFLKEDKPPTDEKDSPKPGEEAP